MRGDNVHCYEWYLVIQWPVTKKTCVLTCFWRESGVWRACVLLMLWLCQPDIVLFRSFAYLLYSNGEALNLLGWKSGYSTQPEEAQRKNKLFLQCHPSRKWGGNGNSHHNTLTNIDVVTTACLGYSWGSIISTPNLLESIHQYPMCLQSGPLCGEPELSSWIFDEQEQSGFSSGLSHMRRAIWTRDGDTALCDVIPVNSHLIRFLAKHILRMKVFFITLYVCAFHEKVFPFSTCMYLYRTVTTATILQMLQQICQTSFGATWGIRWLQLISAICISFISRFQQIFP